MSTPMNNLDQATRALVHTVPRDANVPAAQDPRSTAELVALYTRDPDAPEAGVALGVIHFRGGVEEFNAGTVLANSTIARNRSAGADILAQLGWQDKTFHEESVRILVSLLNDPDALVVQSAAIALGHRHDPAAVIPLADLRNHPAAEVRHGVAYGLAGQDDALAISALIELSADVDREVRDWSTFALGTQTNADTPTIRDALWKRVSDSDAEVRGEAMVGLARRRDQRLKSAVLAELRGEFFGNWVLEAAELLADPELVPALTGLRGRLSPETPQRFFDDLASALAACDRNS
jgi:hypothetical protein